MKYAEGALENFFTLIKGQRESDQWLLIHDYYNESLVNAVIRHGKLHHQEIKIDKTHLGEYDISQIPDNNSVHMVFYNIANDFSRNKKESDAKLAMRKKIFSHIDSYISITDLGDDFSTFYKTHPLYIHQLNQKIIESSIGISQMTIRGVGKNSIEIPVNKKINWSNMNGFDRIGNENGGFYVAVYGELATCFKNICGSIIFSGSIAGSRELALELGLIDMPVSLSINDNYMESLDCENEHIKNTLSAFLEDNPGSRVLTEIGISTNPDVMLKGKNLAIEERHQGLHLGFGGVNKSVHLDFIFSESEIFFDDKKIFGKEGFNFACAKLPYHK